jgi:hypothetical protein
MPRRDVRRIAPEIRRRRKNRLRVRRLDHQQAARTQHTRGFAKEREQRVDGQVFDDMHRQHAAKRIVRERCKTLGNGGQRDFESALLQVGDGALVRIDAARFDSCFATRREEFTAATTDVEHRLMICGETHVVHDVRTHMRLAATQCIFQAAIHDVRRLRNRGIHRIAHTDGNGFDLLIERGDQGVIALRGNDDQLAKPRALRECAREIAPQPIDVRAQIASQRFDVAANVAQQIEQNDVEVFLPLVIGLTRAAHETPESREHPLLLRRAGPEPLILAPHFAPCIGTSGRIVDVAIVRHE